MFTNEERAELKTQHPDFSDGQIELILCCLFSSEIRKKLTGPSDWIRDPKTLLSNLRYLEQWRSVIFSGDPGAFEKFTIHRERSNLFTELRGAVQNLRRELIAVQAKLPLQVSPAELDQLCRNLEQVEYGLVSDDSSDEMQTAAYTVWRLLRDQILTLEIFCNLEEQPVEIVDSDYAEPILKSDLAYMLGVDVVTVRRRINSGELRVIPGTSPTAKKIRVHGDDFPTGLKRPNERKHKLSGLTKSGKRQ